MKQRPTIPAYKLITYGLNNSPCFLSDAAPGAWLNRYALEQDIALTCSENAYTYMPLLDALADSRFVGAGVTDIRDRVAGELPALYAAYSEADNAIIYFGIAITEYYI